ncbi:hypothetical protein ACFL2O_00150 [Thermodesulfobacteriota bacterium]
MAKYYINILIDILFQRRIPFINKLYDSGVFFLNSILLIIFHRKNKEKLVNHFYVIVMPHTLHLLLPCLSLLPKKTNIFLLLNGIAAWEKEYVKTEFKRYPRIEMISRKHKIPHGMVLDLLFANNKSNFGILDSDCYIFNKSIVEELALDKNDFAAGVFFLKNKKTNILFPETFFMFFNTKRIKEIQSKYKISCRVYHKIPSRLEGKLMEMDIGYHNFPFEPLPYFDTMRLVFSMAFYEKLVFKKIAVSKDEAIHVGRVSFDFDAKTAPDLAIRANYFHNKILEITEDPILRKMYLSFFKSNISLEVKENYKNLGLTEIDNLISKLEKWFLNS